MGIADDVEKRRPLRASNFSTVRDKQPCDAATPHIWIDKQGIKLGFSVRPRFDGGKADNHAVPLRYSYAASDDLRDWQFNGVRMSEQGVAIAEVGKGCAQLQIFKWFLLGDSGAANKNIVQIKVQVTRKKEVKGLHGWRSKALLRIRQRELRTQLSIEGGDKHSWFDGDHDHVVGRDLSGVFACEFF